MKVTKIFDNINNNLNHEVLTGACKHQFCGRNLENLVEFAGRICYDSLGVEKTRGTDDYHKHIIEVNHGSVQEHGNIVVNIYDLNSFELHDAICQCVNRPGVAIYYKDNDSSDGKSRFTASVVANLRAIREWDTFGEVTATGLSTSKLDVGVLLKIGAHGSAPRAISATAYSVPENRFTKLHDYTASASVNHDNTTFVSFLIQGVSRNLTHELVRHKFQTAISQRSTRYVDESTSEIAWHPLLDGQFTFLKWASRKLGGLFYKYASRSIRSQLVTNGEDLMTAKKQARGAARGFLPSALSTELVFTASIAQWKRIIAMRGHASSDLEIQQLADQVRDILYKEGFIDDE
jgi:thymidylate synthase ThyX